MFHFLKICDIFSLHSVQICTETAKQYQKLQTATKCDNLAHRYLITLRASLAAQCIVMGPVCLCVGLWVCLLWVCYHDNSKLRPSIFAKLGL